MLATITNLSSTTPLPVPEPFNVVVPASGSVTLACTVESLEKSRFRGSPAPKGELNQLVATGKATISYAKDTVVTSAAGDTAVLADNVGR